MKKVDIKILIKNGDSFFEVLAIDEIQLSYGFSGTPGKFEFTTLSKLYKIEEGNCVKVLYDGEIFFYGFIFDLDRSDFDKVRVTAYDQLRYLKYKDTYSYQNLTYSQLLKKICDDRNLRYRDVEDTGYKIEKRVEEDKEYFDILQTASDITTAYTNKVFILFDKKGEIALHEVNTMKNNNTLVLDSTIQEFSYNSNIDNNTFNRIKVDVIDEVSNVVKPVISEDKATIEKWGVLQYYAQTTENLEKVKDKAKKILGMLNRKERKLSVSGVRGDYDCRGGSLIRTVLKFDDVAVSGYMLVMSCVHIIRDGYHFMNLTLVNKDFLALPDSDGFFDNSRSQSSKIKELSNNMLGGFGGFNNKNFNLKLPNRVRPQRPLSPSGYRNQDSIDGFGGKASLRGGFGAFGGDGLRMEFLKFCLAQEGKKYSQPKRMHPDYFDCSSLIQRGLTAVGLGSKPLFSFTIIGDDRFYQISRRDIIPGDICWHLGHVGVYIGNNSTIEAMNESLGVRKGTLSNRWARFYRVKAFGSVSGGGAR